MAGGLMQLVAHGAQDVYLTGNPQITFFKVVYRRYTSFAMESIQQTFAGTCNFGSKVTCTVSRNGDLIGGVCLEAVLPAVCGSSGDDKDNNYYRWVDNVGEALVESVEVEIGGQRIDRQTGEWMNIWNELSMDGDKRFGYNTMIGQQTPVPFQDGGRNACPCNSLPSEASYTVQAAPECQLQTFKRSHPATRVYVPLQFWFCRQAGLALPLIALQYHEVKVNLTFRAQNRLLVTMENQGDQWKCSGDQSEDREWSCSDDNGCLAPSASASMNGPTTAGAATATVGNLGECQLWVNYVYLDTDERRRFAQAAHEYLITQLQEGTESVSGGRTVKHRLIFNHPVKELVWVVNTATAQANNELFNYNHYPNCCTSKEEQGSSHCSTAPSGQFTGFASNPVMAAQLQLNGHDRFAKRYGSYFSRVQPFEHHSAVPTSAGINVYSFALKPEEHQPSGTCNFSRIDNATLNLTLQSDLNMVTPQRPDQAPGSGCASVTIYAVNYNILRIMSGMGGLAYSN
jgi:hypothetical protein